MKASCLPFSEAWRLSVHTLLAAHRIILRLPRSDFGRGTFLPIETASKWLNAGQLFFGETAQ